LHEEFVYACGIEILCSKNIYLSLNNTKIAAEKRESEKMHPKLWRHMHILPLGLMGSYCIPGLDMWFIRADSQKKWVRTTVEMS